MNPDAIHQSADDESRERARLARERDERFREVAGVVFGKQLQDSAMRFRGCTILIEGELVASQLTDAEWHELQQRERENQ